MPYNKFYNQSEFRYKSIIIKAKQYGIYYLNQSDFDNGTYRITKPGTYILNENIQFNPNSTLNWMPTSDQEQYTSNAYRLGFFAAITIETHDVHINLNNRTLQQHPIHALQQRFYSNIELADQPFIPKQGPADFGAHIQAASRCIIENGTLGISSHHGIHGNNNSDIIIKNVTLIDFEVAGIALNGVNNLLIKSCNIKNNRHTVPVLGTYSASRFIIPVLKYAVNKFNELIFNDMTGSVILNNLQNEMDTVLQEYTNSNFDFSKISNPLYKNKSGLIDGNCYGILVNKVGAAVHSFSNDTKEGLSYNVSITNTQITNLHANVNQIIAIPVENTNNPQLGVFGEVFDFKKATDDQGIYIGNALANAHLFLAKCKLNDSNDMYNTLSITQATVDWAESTDKYSGKIIYNGDSMFHTNKGVLGLRLDSVINSFINSNQINNIYNIGQKFNIDSDSFILDDNFDIVGDYSGHKSHGIVMSSSKNVWIHNQHIYNIDSKFGYSYGIAIINKTYIANNNNNIVEKVTGKYGDCQLFVDGDSKWLI